MISSPLICCILASALEGAGRAANAAVASADAANWRRENSLVLGMISLLVGSRGDQKLPSGLSGGRRSRRGILCIPQKENLWESIPARLSIPATRNRRSA